MRSPFSIPLFLYTSSFAERKRTSNMVTPHHSTNLERLFCLSSTSSSSSMFIRQLIVRLVIPRSLIFQILQIPILPLQFLFQPLHLRLILRITLDSRITRSLEIGNRFLIRKNLRNHRIRTCQHPVISQPSKIYPGLGSRWWREYNERKSVNPQRYIFLC